MEDEEEEKRKQEELRKKIKVGPKIRASPKKNDDPKIRVIKRDAKKADLEEPVELSPEEAGKIADKEIYKTGIRRQAKELRDKMANRGFETDVRLEPRDPTAAQLRRSRENEA